MTDMEKLLETIRRIEALHARTDLAGERAAAAAAMENMRARLEQVREEDPPIEYKFTMNDSWSRRLFTALMRRYGIKPYRYRGQRYTTVMARVSRSFVDETLWPEFVELSDVLHKYLSEVTDRVIREAIYEDSSEAEERTPAAKIEDMRRPR